MRLNHFNYIQKEQNPHGKVILVGMLEDGPTGTPFTLKENGSAKALLGDNETTRTYNRLIQNGTPVEDILLFRLNGIPARAEIEVDDEVALTLEAMTSHSEDQRLNLTVSEEGVAIVSNYSDEAIESGRRKDYRRSYRFDEYPYLALLAEEITKDATLGLHNVLAEHNINYPSKRLADDLGPRAFLYGDEEETLIVTDGQYPEDEPGHDNGYFYEYWQRFYYQLLGNDFDGESSSKILDISAEAIYFPDIPIDEMPELAILAGRIAEEKTENQGLLCTALFRTNTVPQVRTLDTNEYLNEDGTFYNRTTDQDEPWLPEKEQEEFIEKLVNTFTEEEKDFSEMGYVQIVVGDEQTSYGELIPGAVSHLTHLIDQSLQASTNKELRLFEQIHAPLNKIHIDKLSRNGYICIVESIRRNAVTSKVQTMFNEIERIDSFYFKKIISYISYDIKELLDQYIGQNLTLQSMVIIEDVLYTYLQQYVDERLIQSFKIQETEMNPKESTSDINLEIVMYGELENIKGSVQLNEAGWEVDLWEI